MTSFKESKVGKVAIDITTSGLYLVFILYGVLRDQYDKVNYMMSSPKKKNDNNNILPEAPPPPTFKEQLDKEAIDSRVHQHESEGNSTVKAVVDKSEFCLFLLSSTQRVECANSHKMVAALRFTSDI